MGQGKQRVRTITSSGPKEPPLVLPPAAKAPAGFAPNNGRRTSAAVAGEAAPEAICPVTSDAAAASILSQGAESTALQRRG